MSRDDRRERLVAAGRWLRDQRQKHGFATAAGFARRLDIDRAVLSNYERGVNAIDDDRAKQIADVLGMNLMEVRRGLGLWVPDDRSDGQLLDDMEAALDRIEARLDARMGEKRRRQRQAAIDIVRAEIQESTTQDT